MVQPFDNEIENVMLVAEFKDNFSAFTIKLDDVATNLSWVDELK